MATMKRLVWLVVILLVAITTPTRATDLARESVPRRWIEPYLPEDLPELVSPSYYTQLERARAQVFAGHYKAGLITLYKTKDAEPAAAALIRAQALSAIGRGNAALEALNHLTTPDVFLQRAKIFEHQGRLAEAVAAIQDCLKGDPQSIAAHYGLGALLEERGEIRGAKDAYAWFISAPQSFLEKWQGSGGKAFDNAEQVVLIGRALDRWASLNSAYQKSERLNDVILGMFIRAYDVIDRGYWPAHVAAAEYFRSHDDREQAVNELQLALNANPNDQQALELMGTLSMEVFNFDLADKAIATLRAVDANSWTADLLEARNLMQQRRPTDAQPLIEKVVAAQPQSVEALGLLAAVNALQLRDAKTKEILAQVDKLDPQNASAYYAVAEQLGAMRQYPRAEAMYKIAVERAPWWTAVRNDLGLLYTQSGDEDSAQAVLEQAHSLDPFNVRTTNYLRLLDGLRQFTRKETAHFIVMYDEAADPMIPEYFSDYLESVYPQVTGEYHCEPPQKTMIEVFPTHEAFSVRTTGSPWIGTVGASTGRVIALVAPRKGTMTMGTFNWSQVLRHEFTHTVTLSATDNRISHWMTEGLAVYQEHSPLRWEWVPMLYHAVTQHELFTLDNLTWGFVRPKRPIDRQLAYAQSFWICTYIEQKYGHAAILKMLGAFRNGGQQDDVFPSVLGRSISDFSTDFFAWTEQQVSTWGYDKDTTAKYEALRDRGEELIASKQYAEAVTLWEQIAKLRPVDALPHQRLAGLYLTKQVNQPAKAVEHLIALHKVELKDNRYAKRIARIDRDTGNLEEGVYYAQQAVYVDPYDVDAHELLAQLDEKAGKADAAARETHMVAVLHDWSDAQKKPSAPEN